MLWEHNTFMGSLAASNLHYMKDWWKFGAADIKVY